MAWKIEWSPAARRDLERLDPQHAKRIAILLIERVARLDDPQTVGELLVGQRFGEFWRYPVGDYRILSKVVDEQIVIVVVKVGHRREVYR